MINIVAAKNVVETWNINKLHGREFNQSDMRKFIEVMNDRTKALIHWTELRDPALAQSYAVIAQDAVSLINGDPIETDMRHSAARILISQFGVNEADFYTGLMELYVHAATLLTPRAKLFVDGKDMTDV